MHRYTQIPLASLREHPLAVGKLPASQQKKLARNIAASGLYPPLIVRPLAGAYEILDGRQRAAALRSLEYTHADCIIWPVDSATAMLLLATLNRLAGKDDPRKRATLLEAMHKTQDVKSLAAHLRETPAKLRKLLSLNTPAPKPRPALPPGAMPSPVHFFLPTQDRARLEAFFKTHRGSRETVWMALLEAAEREG